MRKLLAGTVLALASLGSWAVTTSISGLTYTSYFDGDPGCCETAPGFFSNIDFGAERARGFAEFNLAGLISTSVQSASLSFTLSAKQNVFGGAYSVSAFEGTLTPSTANLNIPLKDTLVTINFADFLVGSTFIVDATRATETALYDHAVSVGVTVPQIPPYRFGAAGPAYFGLGNMTLTVVSSASPVPEPETYALMLGGLGVLGLLATRRRTR